MPKEELEAKVLAILRKPGGPELPNRRIAALTGVSQHTVAVVREKHGYQATFIKVVRLGRSVPYRVQDTRRKTSRVDADARGLRQPVFCPHCGKLIKQKKGRA